MKYLLIVAFTGLTFFCRGQEIVLRILGKDARVEYAITNGVLVTFEEDPKKCDPRFGFTSIDQQLLEFEEALKAEGIVTEIVRINDLVYTDYPKHSYRIEESDSDVFTDILGVCTFKAVKVDKLYFKYPKHDYSNEDNRAVSAFRNARQKAEIIASYLNCDITSTLNIDDDTNDSNDDLGQYFDDAEQREQFLDLIRLLSQAYSSINEESKDPKRSGAYNLWVTFALNPK